MRLQPCKTVCSLTENGDTYSVLLFPGGLYHTEMKCEHSLSHHVTGDTEKTDKIGFPPEVFPGHK